MDNFNADLELLENLSKKISDLIYNNDFSQIFYIDKQRRALIKKITDSEHKKKCFELWKNTFRKDFEFADELLVIANRVKKNTNLDVFLEYLL